MFDIRGFINRAKTAFGFGKEPNAADGNDSISVSLNNDADWVDTYGQGPSKLAPKRVTKASDSQYVELVEIEKPENEPQEQPSAPPISNTVAVSVSSSLSQPQPASASPSINTVAVSALSSPSQPQPASAPISELSASEREKHRQAITLSFDISRLLQYLLSVTPAVIATEINKATKSYKAPSVDRPTFLSAAAQSTPVDQVAIHAQSQRAVLAVYKDVFKQLIHYLQQDINSQFTSVDSAIFYSVERQYNLAETVLSLLPGFQLNDESTHEPAIDQFLAQLAAQSLNENNTEHTAASSSSVTVDMNASALLARLEEISAASSVVATKALPPSDDDDDDNDALQAQPQTTAALAQLKAQIDGPLGQLAITTPNKTARFDLLVKGLAGDPITEIQAVLNAIYETPISELTADSDINNDNLNRFISNLERLQALSQMNNLSDGFKQYQIVAKYTVAKIQAQAENNDLLDGALDLIGNASETKAKIDASSAEKKPTLPTTLMAFAISGQSVDPARTIGSPIFADDDPTRYFALHVTNNSQALVNLHGAALVQELKYNYARPRIVTGQQSLGLQQTKNPDATLAANTKSWTREDCIDKLMQVDLRDDRQLAWFVRDLIKQIKIRKVTIASAKQAGNKDAYRQHVPDLLHMISIFRALVHTDENVIFTLTNKNPNINPNKEAPPSWLSSLNELEKELTKICEKKVEQNIDVLGPDQINEMKALLQELHQFGHYDLGNDEKGKTLIESLKQLDVLRRKPVADNLDNPTMQSARSYLLIAERTLHTIVGDDNDLERAANAFLRRNQKSFEDGFQAMPEESKRNLRDKPRLIFHVMAGAAAEQSKKTNATATQNREALEQGRLPLTAARAQTQLANYFDTDLMAAMTAPDADNDDLLKTMKDHCITYAKGGGARFYRAAYPGVSANISAPVWSAALETFRNKPEYADKKTFQLHLNFALMMVWLGKTSFSNHPAEKPVVDIFREGAHNSLIFATRFLLANREMNSAVLKNKNQLEVGELADAAWQQTIPKAVWQALVKLPAVEKDDSHDVKALKLRAVTDLGNVATFIASLFEEIPTKLAKTQEKFINLLVKNRAEAVNKYNEFATSWLEPLVHRIPSYEGEPVVEEKVSAAASTTVPVLQHPLSPTFDPQAAPPRFATPPPIQQADERADADGPASVAVPVVAGDRALSRNKPRNNEDLLAGLLVEENNENSLFYDDAQGAVFPDGPNQVESEPATSKNKTKPADVRPSHSLADFTALENAPVVSGPLVRPTSSTGAASSHSSRTDAQLAALNNAPVASEPFSDPSGPVPTLDGLPSGSSSSPLFGPAAAPARKTLQSEPPIPPMRPVATAATSSPAVTTATNTAKQTKRQNVRPPAQPATQQPANRAAATTVAPAVVPVVIANTSAPTVEPLSIKCVNHFRRRDGWAAKLRKSPGSVMPRGQKISWAEQTKDEYIQDEMNTVNDWSMKFDPPHAGTDLMLHLNINEDVISRLTTLCQQQDGVKAIVDMLSESGSSSAMLTPELRTDVRNVTVALGDHLMAMIQLGHNDFTFPAKIDGIDGSENLMTLFNDYRHAYLQAWSIHRCERGDREKSPNFILKDGSDHGARHIYADNLKDFVQLQSESQTKTLSGVMVKQVKNLLQQFNRAPGYEQALQLKIHQSWVDNYRVNAELAKQATHHADNTVVSTRYSAAAPSLFGRNQGGCSLEERQLHTDYSLNPRAKYGF